MGSTLILDTTLDDTKLLCEVLFAAWISKMEFHIKLNVSNLFDKFDAISKAYTAHRANQMRIQLKNRERLTQAMDRYDKF